VGCGAGGEEPSDTGTDAGTSTQPGGSEGVTEGDGDPQGDMLPADVVSPNMNLTTYVGCWLDGMYTVDNCVRQYGVNIRADGVDVTDAVVTLSVDGAPAVPIPYGEAGYWRLNEAEPLGSLYQFTVTRGDDIAVAYGRAEAFAVTLPAGPVAVGAPVEVTWSPSGRATVETKIVAILGNGADLIYSGDPLADPGEFTIPAGELSLPGGYRVEVLRAAWNIVTLTNTPTSTSNRTQVAVMRTGTMTVQ
jgi:hypothetical protein